VQRLSPGWLLRLVMLSALPCTVVVSSTPVSGVLVVCVWGQLLGGDLVVIEPGGVIPSDGRVIEGAAMVEESAITGESAPVLRECGTGAVARRADHVAFAHERRRFVQLGMLRKLPGAARGRVVSTGPVTRASHSTFRLRESTIRPSSTPRSA